MFQQSPIFMISLLSHLHSVSSKSRDQTSCNFAHSTIIFVTFYSAIWPSSSEEMKHNTVRQYKCNFVISLPFLFSKNLTLNICIHSMMDDEILNQPNHKIGLQNYTIFFNYKYFTNSIVCSSILCISACKYCVICNLSVWRSG